MSEVLVDKRWMFRIGGYAAVAGAVVGLVGSLIHPETSGPGDPEATARVVADSQIWVPLHFALAVAFILMLLGLVAIHDSITGGLAGALARLGLASAVVGTAIGVIVVSLVGFAAKHLADAWSSAPADARAGALTSFRADDSINFALLSPLNLVFAGFTFVLFGLAVAAGDVSTGPGYRVAVVAVALGTVCGALTVVGQFGYCAQQIWDQRACNASNATAIAMTSRRSNRGSWMSTRYRSRSPHLRTTEKVGWPFMVNSKWYGNQDSESTSRRSKATTGLRSWPVASPRPGCATCQVERSNDWPKFFRNRPTGLPVASNTS